MKLQHKIYKIAVSIFTAGSFLFSSININQAGGGSSQLRPLAAVEKEKDPRVLLVGDVFTRYVEIPVSFGDMDQLICDSTFIDQLTELLLWHACPMFRSRKEWAFDVSQDLPFLTLIELQRRGQEYHNLKRRAIVGPLYGGKKNTNVGEKNKGVMVHTHPAVYETPSGDKFLTPLGALWPSPGDIATSPQGSYLWNPDDRFFYECLYVG